ncbi:hypothetical protein GKC41_07870 [Bifidobacterium asteroides]|uniref:Uncharacterized protein n=2 Tax=Bifidobacterium asteroides TaxID=1684 RepID=A0A6N7TV36_9BIFI|nr:hypothetical protein [Bifidobacterium asteroides]
MRKRLQAALHTYRCCSLAAMACRGRKSDTTGEDTENTDLRRTIHVPPHADLVLWLLGLALLLPMSWGWYSKIPIQFFMAFPDAVDFASDTWVNRIIATTIVGLVCWLISGIIHIVALYKGKSRKARKWWNVVTKILLVLVTLIVLLHSLAGVLFLSIDVSDIPL